MGAIWGVLNLGDARGVMDSAPAEASFVRVKGASEPVTSRSGASVNFSVNCKVCYVTTILKEVKYTSFEDALYNKFEATSPPPQPYSSPDSIHRRGLP